MSSAIAEPSPRIAMYRPAQTGDQLRTQTMTPGRCVFEWLHGGRPPFQHVLFPASTMLTRSFVAVLCGALAVAASPGVYYPYEEYADPAGEQWVARLDKPHPGSPWQPNHPEPPHPPPHPPRDPHHAPHHPKVDDKTIFQALEDDDR